MTTIPSNVEYAIGEMFLCENLMEHLACYQHFHDELKDCTFIVFSEKEGTQLPKALCCGQPFLKHLCLNKITNIYPRYC